MNIYISPHHDDVCFSIGALAARNGGILLNVFTRSDHVAGRRRIGRLLGPLWPAIVTARRNREDRRFARAAGLERRDLGLADAPLAGEAPFGREGLARAAERLAGVIAPVLLGLLESGDPSASRIYCPMGIGGHRNHLTVLMAVLGAVERLQGRCSIFLYEDLYYARDAAARREGLDRAHGLCAPAGLSCEPMALDPDETRNKLAWIGFYDSQHARPPLMASYSPASGLIDGAHEIVWRLSARPGADHH